MASECRDPGMCRLFYWCIAAKLNTIQARVIMLRYGSRMTLQEIGEMTEFGMSKQGVAYIERCAKKKLKKYLKKNSDQWGIMVHT